jgi:hypothetical protein
MGTIVTAPPPLRKQPVGGKRRFLFQCTRPYRMITSLGGQVGVAALEAVAAVKAAEGETFRASRG